MSRRALICRWQMKAISSESNFVTLTDGLGRAGPTSAMCGSPESLAKARLRNGLLTRIAAKARAKLRHNPGFTHDDMRPSIRALYKEKTQITRTERKSTDCTEFK